MAGPAERGRSTSAQLGQLGLDDSDFGVMVWWLRCTSRSGRTRRPDPPGSSCMLRAPRRHDLPRRTAAIAARRQRTYRRLPRGRTKRGHPQEFPAKLRIVTFS